MIEKGCLGRKGWGLGEGEERVFKVRVSLFNVFFLRRGKFFFLVLIFYSRFVIVLFIGNCYIVFL